jgi:hypothetical protein
VSHRSVGHSLPAREGSQGQVFSSGRQGTRVRRAA